MKHPRELGGITILLALILITAMGAMAFSLSQESMREIAISGSESTGRKAAEAADSGIDWTIVWGNANGVTTDQISIKTAMDTLVDAIDLVEKRVPGVDATPGTPGTGNMSPSGYLRTYLYSSPTSSDLTMAKTGYTQATEVQQAFDIEIRFLGAIPIQGQGMLTAQRAASQGGNQARRYYFLVRSLGRANIGTTGQSFVAMREIISDRL